MREINVFTMPADRWDETAPDKQAILHLITKHERLANELRKLKGYYEGKHKILGEDRENKLVCNHAKDIADTASAYFIGNPVAYKSPDDISELTQLLDAAGADEADGDNGLDLSIYGRAYEYIYTEEGDTGLCICNLEPEHTFIVYDDTIEQRELFAVYYYWQRDATDRTTGRYIATVLTKNYKYVLNIEQVEGPQALIEGPEPHFKGEVPVIEYRNNKLAIGDYQLQIPLIDAYNALMSDRITDKEQFIDSILVLYGTLLSDEAGGESSLKDAQEKLKRRKILEMPADNSKAEYLTRTFDEAGVEILKKALEQDIHKFSHIPCMTDESFGGNVSGVAMEYKLLGMENITKIKSRYYRKGLRKRLRIFCGWIQTKGGAAINYDAVTPIFTRAMPKNLLEISQYVANLWGKVSHKTLLSQIPFVDDVDEEVETVKEENLESIRQQQEMFGLTANTKPDNDSGDKSGDNSDDEEDW